MACMCIVRMFLERMSEQERGTCIVAISAFVPILSLIEIEMARKFPKKVLSV